MTGCNQNIVMSHVYIAGTLSEILEHLYFGLKFYHKFPIVYILLHINDILLIKYSIIIFKSLTCAFFIMFLEKN